MEKTMETPVSGLGLSAIGRWKTKRNMKGKLHYYSGLEA